TIHDLHLRRELITIGQDVVTDAFQHDLDDPAVEQIERAEQKLFELATAGEAEGGPQPFARALTSAITMAEAAFKRDGKTVGVATNFVDLDKKLGGLHPSDLIILAGRPSMGKTSLATNIAFGAAKAYRSSRAPSSNARTSGRSWRICVNPARSSRTPTSSCSFSARSITCRGPSRRIARRRPRKNSTTATSAGKSAVRRPMASPMSSSPS